MAIRCTEPLQVGDYIEFEDWWDGLNLIGKIVAMKATNRTVTIEYIPNSYLPREELAVHDIIRKMTVEQVTQWLLEN